MKKYVLVILFSALLLFPVITFASNCYVIDNAGILYRIDNTSGQTFLIGSVGYQCTDIAFSSVKGLYGITFDSLIKIDTLSGKGELVGQLNETFSANALAFSPNNELYAADTSGRVLKIDLIEGSAKHIANFSPSYHSSGDIVFSDSDNLIATAKSSLESINTDFIVKINIKTNTSQIIGMTNNSNIYGLSYSNGQLFGFTDTGCIISIDIFSGYSNLIMNLSKIFWGASEQVIIL